MFGSVHPSVRLSVHLSIRLLATALDTWTQPCTVFDGILIYFPSEICQISNSTSCSGQLVVIKIYFGVPDPPCLRKMSFILPDMLEMVV